MVLSWKKIKWVQFYDLWIVFAETKICYTKLLKFWIFEKICEVEQLHQIFWNAIYRPFFHFWPSLTDFFVVYINQKTKICKIHKSYAQNITNPNFWKFWRARAKNINFWNFKKSDFFGGEGVATWFFWVKVRART